MKQRGYLSYLVRVWQTRDGDTAVWRASLESPGSGERRNFASLDALVAYLYEQTDPKDKNKLKDG